MLTYKPTVNPRGLFTGEQTHGARTGMKCLPGDKPTGLVTEKCILLSIFGTQTFYENVTEISQMCLNILFLLTICVCTEFVLALVRWRRVNIMGLT